MARTTDNWLPPPPPQEWLKFAIMMTEVEVYLSFVFLGSRSHGSSFLTAAPLQTGSHAHTTQSPTLHPSVKASLVIIAKISYGKIFVCHFYSLDHELLARGIIYDYGSLWLTIIVCVRVVLQAIAPGNCMEQRKDNPLSVAPQMQVEDMEMQPHPFHRMQVKGMQMQPHKFQ